MKKRIAVIFIVSVIISAAFLTSPGQVYGDDTSDTPPKVTGVTFKLDEYLGFTTVSFGQKLIYIVSFDQTVYADITDGIPYIEIGLGNEQKARAYLDTNGSTSIESNIFNFIYRPQEGDYDGNGIDKGSSITLNGGRMENSSGTSIDTTLYGMENRYIYVDVIKSYVKEITLPQDKAYKAGDELIFTVKFYSTMGAKGTSYIPLILDGERTVNAACTYPSGGPYNVTWSSSYSYTVQPGDMASGGIKLGDSIVDGDFKGRVDTFFVKEFDRSLTTVLAGKDLSGIRIDAQTPSAIAFEPPSPATYSAGRSIDFIVEFNETVFVNTGSGIPYISILLDGGIEKKAEYSEGSGTSTLVFKYRVGAGDTDTDGISTDDCIVLNGGTICDVAGNPIPLETGFTGRLSGVCVDGKTQILFGEVPDAGTYLIGDTLEFSLKFDQPVNVSSGGSPYIELNLEGGVLVKAYYTRGSGTQELFFSYQVESGVGDSNNITLGGQIQLNGGNIEYLEGGLPSLLISSLPDISGIIIKGKSPRVLSVSVPSGGSYDSGKELRFIVQYDEAVHLDAGETQPYLVLNIGDKVRQAGYISGSGSTTLVFMYTVQEDDIAPDGIGVGAEIILPTGALKDADGNQADLKLNNVGDLSVVKLIGRIPKVVSVSPDEESKIYKEYEDITITIVFNEEVYVSYLWDFYKPYITLHLDNGVNVNATFVEGSGTKNLVFKYNIEPYVNDADGIIIGNNINLNYECSIKDSDGNNADLALNGHLPDKTGILIDTEEPYATSVDVPANKAYKAGSELEFIIHFNEKIENNPTKPLPYLFFYASGWKDFIADYVDGLGTASLRFRYTVKDGDAFTGIRFQDLINGHLLTDQTGHIISYRSTDSEMPSLTGIILDGVKPQVQSVAMPDNGSYGAGAQMVFKVRFDEPVFVDEAVLLPQISIISEADDNAKATYLSGSGSQELLFSYTVKPGTADADGITLGGTILNASAIHDAAGNPAQENIKNVADGGNVLIDGICPSIVSVVVPGEKIYKAGDTLEITVEFDENVNVNITGGIPTLPFTVNEGITSESAAYLEGTGTRALKFSYTIKNEDHNNGTLSAGSALQLGGGTIKDPAGNDAVLDIGSDIRLISVSIDTVAPEIISAERIDNTHISVQLSESCMNLENTNDGGFTVTEKLDGPGTELVYEVVSTSQGMGDRHVVLNLSGMGRSARKGLTVKYNSAFAGVIEDLAGNTMLIDAAGVEIDPWDTVGPTIISTTLDSQFKFLDITFDEGVYGAEDGAAALVKEMLQMDFLSNEGNAKEVNISSVKQNASDVESVSPDLAGGEKTVRVFLSMDGRPSGVETIEIGLSTGSLLYDLAGNPSSADLTTGKIKLIYIKPPSPSSPSFYPSVPANNPPRLFTSVESSKNGQTINTLFINSKVLADVLSEMKDAVASIQIHAAGDADIIDVRFDGYALSQMLDRSITMEVVSDDVIYSIPIQYLNIEPILRQQGQAISSGAITMTITIADVSNEQEDVIREIAERNNYQAVAGPVEFTVTCSVGGQSLPISSFTGYVDRYIVIPDGVDPAEVTTGVVLNEDGTALTHVPTSIVQINGRYYARISSRTNSIYTLISNQARFKDMKGHWAESDVNEMFSRLIVTGVSNEKFLPEQYITRAEFTAILIRSLGIAHSAADGNVYSDVVNNKWYYSAVGTAYQYRIAPDDKNGRYRPEDFITRIEAMEMLYRAMKATGYNTSITQGEMDRLTAGFADGNEFSKNHAAAICIKEGLIQGANGRISGNNNLTRSQAAAVIKRMLDKTGLIIFELQ